MGVGAIGGLTYQPYIYNTNTVSRNSLNPISAVDNDVTRSHIGQAAESEVATINPLQRGETANFADVLSMQMSMGMQKASALFGGESVFNG